MKKRLRILSFRKWDAKSFFFPDEEALFVVAAEMRGLASQQKNRCCFAIQMNNAIQDIIEKKQGSAIVYKSQLQYCRRLIQRVNTTEPEEPNQKKRSKTMEIRVAGLRKKSAKHLDP